MNMSYCRFQNTELDLRDCADAIAYPNDEKLSEEEENAKRRLICICRDIIQMIDFPEGELDEHSAWNEDYDEGDDQ